MRYARCSNAWFYAVLSILVWDFANRRSVVRFNAVATMLLAGLAVVGGHPGWGLILGAVAVLAWRKAG